MGVIKMFLANVRPIFVFFLVMDAIFAQQFDYLKHFSVTNMQNRINQEGGKYLFTALYQIDN